MKLYKQSELFVVQDKDNAYSEGMFPTLDHAFAEGMLTYKPKPYYVVREVWLVIDESNETQRIKKEFEVYGDDKQMIGTFSDIEGLLKLKNSCRLGDTK